MRVAMSGTGYVRLVAVDPRNAYPSQEIARHSFVRASIARRS